MNQNPEYLSNSVFEDIDRFTEAGRDWDADFCQLEPGRLNARLLQTATEETRLVETRFDRKIAQQGSAPVGCFTFAVPMGDDPKIVWRQWHVPPGSILVYRPGSEIDAASRPGFHVVAISIEDAAFAQLANQLGYPEVADVARRAEIVPLAKTMQHRLQADLRRFCSTLRESSAEGLDQLQRKMLKHHLPAQIIRAMASGLPAPRQSPLRDRHRALRVALGFVTSNANNALTVSDLCRATGTSERVLQYAFRERFDVTPGAYLKATRLVAVRRRLLSAVPRKGMINEFAMEWGFWHMGQFAADYRVMFGELPSQTLRNRLNPTRSARHLSEV